jgi:hypothetical protein
MYPESLDDIIRLKCMGTTATPRVAERDYLGHGRVEKNADLLLFVALV